MIYVGIARSSRITWMNNSGFMYVLCTGFAHVKRNAEFSTFVHKLYTGDVCAKLSA